VPKEKQEMCAIENCNRPAPKSTKLGHVCRSCTHLWVNYRIRTPDRNKMLEKQNHKCKICDTKIKIAEGRGQFKNNTAVVDHCHKTNKIRGILCSKCNTGLGDFKDQKELLFKAFTYLIENESK